MKNQPPTYMLNETDIQLLTGYTRPSDQCRALTDMGIKHRVRPDGRPAVTRQAADGKDSRASETPTLKLGGLSAA